jgi:hypothetical protein
MQIQFTEEQAAQLRLESKNRGVSISSIVRERVDRAPASLQSKSLERAFRSFGMGRSGVTDLAENHDDYYVEAVMDQWKR